MLLVLSPADQLQERGNIRMSKEFCDIDGEVVAADDLTISRAKDFATAVETAEFAYPVECRRTTSGSEIIVFDADVEVSQKPVHDIRYLERIAVIFDGSDATMPEILALRCDFPSVPHINLGSREFPRSLCITEQAYSEWKLHSTGVTFVEEIRQWLISTAKGTLHAEDQRLEPLLLGSEEFLVIPHDLFSKSVDSEPLFLSIEDSGIERKTYIAKRPKDVNEDSNFLGYVAFSFLIEPQTHGVIRRAPETLFELHKFLENSNADLLSELRNNLKAWKEKNTNKELLERRLALIIGMPKKRDEGSVPETIEFRAFLTFETIMEVGIEIGLWDKSDGDIGYLISIDKNKVGKQIQIGMLNPVSSLSRRNAAQFNNLPSQSSKKIAAVGLGALGSQIFINLVRAGYGEWTLIDKDFMLPHNLARHALPGIFIGGAKSHWMAEFANCTIDGAPIANSIVADVLNPPESPETLDQLKEAFNTADIILDVSASISVARYLVHDVDSPARRISLFLNPAGTDVTILAEDLERNTTLDSLEMQYYRHLINENCLEGHLKGNHGRIPYATSCRDVSSTIPQDFVALQAAICSRTIHQITSDEQAFMSIWRIDEDQISVQRYSFPVKNSIKYQIGEWTLCMDGGFLDKVHKARSKKLPNETGGVLVGMYDVQRKIVYVIDCLPSPPDSEEWPTLYIRGCQDLSSQVEKIGWLTENQVKYIGEWHSHPVGCGVSPSQADRQVFDWLSDHMKTDGLPPLMLIVGDPGRYAFYLDQID